MTSEYLYFFSSNKSIITAYVILCSHLKMITIKFGYYRKIDSKKKLRREMLFYLQRHLTVVHVKTMIN